MLLQFPHGRPTPGRPVMLGRSAALAVCAAVALVAGACSGDDESDDVGSDAETTTTASQFGSSMGVERATPSQIAELGPGPSVGDTWSVPVGWNICGQFLEPLPVLDGGDPGPFVVTPTGAVEISPIEAGAPTPTVGDLAAAVGVELSPGNLTMPAGTVPAVLGSTDPSTPVAGETFTNGDRCSDTEGTVQVWVYSADAVDSGNGIRVVTADPQEVPFAEDGMAVVVTFTPESSLPTLPPAAINRS